MMAAGAFAKNVPYVRTPEYAVNRMLKLADVRPGDVVYDLGCGDGRIVIAAAKLGARGVGIDINPVRIEEAQNYARRAGVSDKTSFFVHDALTAKFGDATVVCLYMLPEFNIKLRPQLLSQLKPGTRIVAYTFGIGDWLPDKTENSGSPGYDIYLWIVPAKIAGEWDCVLQTPTGPQHVMLNLRQKYQQVTGVARIGSQSYALQNAKLIGNRLSFALELPGANGPMQYTVTMGATTQPTTKTGQ